MYLWLVNFKRHKWSFTYWGTQEELPLIPWYKIRSEGAQRSSCLSIKMDTVAQQEGRVILQEFLLVTLPQYVLFKTIREKRGKREKNQTSRAGIWDRGPCGGSFLFFSLLTDWDKCSNPKIWRWEGRVRACACAFSQLEDHWMYLLPRRSTCLVTEESTYFFFGGFLYDNNH